jgi:CheY-like chemotaxis protein
METVMINNTEIQTAVVDSVCVIDDDDIYQFTISRLIKITQAAHKLLCFRNGREAINYFIEQINNPDKLPDVIFLDINMPIMDGWDFLQEYIPLKQKLSKKITLYMTSSSVDEKDIERVKNYSEVTDYVLKPITKEKVTELIAKANSLPL